MHRIDLMLSSREKMAKMFKKSCGSIRPNRFLPAKLIIPNAGHVHFYQLGLTFFVPKEPVKRSFSFNPYFVLFVEMFYFGRSMAALYVAAVPENRDYFVKTGDYMYFIRAKTHINMAAMQYMMIGISITVVNFVRFLLKTYPTFFFVYDFLSGKRTPSEVGLRKRTSVSNIVLRAHTAMHLVRASTLLVFWASLFLSLVSFLIHMTTIEFVVYGIPWSIVFAFASFYTFSTYFWNLGYFYILCHFIKIQMNETNELSEAIIGRSRSSRMVNMNYLQRQYIKISQNVLSYNKTYWSTYLFLAILFVANSNNTGLYTAIYVNVNVVVRGSLFYACFNSFSAVFLLLNKASLVYTESERTRKIVSSLHAKSHQKLSYRQLYRMSQIIESLSNRIGFSLANMFTINYARFLEIMFMIIAFFLKIVDLSRKKVLV